MSLLNKRRSYFSEESETEEDPVSSMANLFDVSVVFIVALFFALFMAYKTLDLFNPDSELVITKTTSNGEIQIITKKGKEVKIEKVTETSESGKGVKLGTAYELEDGRIIYIPEK
ncbi:DUF2149 domain-containing protein [Reichenbachiella versicolor]|uniref:DUF2149 domain-containing protein n=1 Tax=Reichenbachiella versicolor TaxID=1821036 RepID=UPI000D6EA72D|nr:DUF2149 domain-containing protein [Reichenbachiella versicolor]